MNPIPAFAVLAGQLFGTAFASGLNLYATVGLLGLASRLGWMAHLPPGLRGLENGLVIGSAIVLFVIEFILEKVKYAGAVWDAVHTIVRPFAAAFLAALALDAMPWEIKLAGGVTSAAVALAAHSSQAGLRVMVANSRFRGPLAISLTTLLLDAAAVALAISTLLYPTAALIAVGAALVLSIAVGPRLWRAAAFGAESVLRRARGLFGRHGWLARDGLPRVVRAAVPLAEIGRSDARGARAVAHGVPGAGAYRSGWLIIGDDGGSFVFRTFVSAKRVMLPAGALGEISPGPLTDSLRMTNGKRGYTIYLFKDGPPAEQALAELEAAP